MKNDTRKVDDLISAIQQIEVETPDTLLARCQETIPLSQRQTGHKMELGRRTIMKPVTTVAVVALCLCFTAPFATDFYLTVFSGKEETSGGRSVFAECEREMQQTPRWHSVERSVPYNRGRPDFSRSLIVEQWFDADRGMLTYRGSRNSSGTTPKESMGMKRLFLPNGDYYSWRARAGTEKRDIVHIEPLGSARWANLRDYERLFIGALGHLTATATQNARMVLSNEETIMQTPEWSVLKTERGTWQGRESIRFLVGVSPQSPVPFPKEGPPIQIVIHADPKSKRFLALQAHELIEGTKEPQPISEIVFDYDPQPGDRFDPEKFCAGAELEDLRHRRQKGP